MSKRKIYTSAFWLDTSERVIGTAAATAAPTFLGTNAFGIDYAVAAGITLSAAAFTTLKCIIAATIGDKGTAALLPTGTPTAGDLNG